MVEMYHKNFMTRVLCALSLCCLCVFTARTAFAQDEMDVRQTSYSGRTDMTPGRVGTYRTYQAPYGSPVDETYFQTVKLTAPRGALVAGAVEGQFEELAPAPQTYGMNIGKVYRFRVTGIRLHPGVEVFPTVEIVDRTHPPLGEETKYPILIELAEEDLIFAAQGKYVTRVIYIEDPNTALPVPETEHSRQGYFEITPGADPLAVASILGRPVAILRIGGRAPVSAMDADMDFLYQCPPLLRYPTAGAVMNVVTGNTPGPPPLAPLPEAMTLEEMERIPE